MEASAHRHVNPWIVTVSVMLATFMELLDTTVVNVAIPHISGNLAATVDEGTWVVTSYLVANAIVLPMSGWLARYLGRKKLLLICVTGFTVTSLFCGLATSLSGLIFFRVLQGLTGGGLQPLAQAILADTFPPEKRGLAFSLYGVTAIVAPSIGPTLGGWITDNYSWRWIFYINLPVGILALLLVYRMIEDPAYISRNVGKSLRIDYIGFGLLALGVGALQILLDKGQEDDWFGSNFIVALAVTASVCLVSLVIYEWRHKEPIVDVRLFKNSNFAAANMSCDGTARGRPCAGERMLRELSISTDASTCDSGESGMCTAIWSPSKSALNAAQTSGCRWIALPSTSWGSKAWMPKRCNVGARFKMTG